MEEYLLKPDWQEQWLAYRMAITERAKLREQKSRDKKASVKESGSASAKERKRPEKSKDVMERKDKDGNNEPRGTSSKEIDRKKSEEPPPLGFILQTNDDKDARVRQLRSTSLSLESLFDYSDIDVEESTFELSLFAESFYEMLVFQMGSRILAFLQNSLPKSVTQRNSYKMQREHGSGKERTEVKRFKSEQDPKDEKSTNTEGENNEEVKTDVEQNQISNDKQESKEQTNKDKTA